MSFFTEDYLRSKAEKLTINKSASEVLNEEYVSKESKFINDSKRIYSIFLSHSIKDAELILGLRTEFINNGFSVYIDWIEDPELDRKNVTRKTADRLRKMMRASHCLLFAESNNSEYSKWMPWELGYFDGFNPNKVATIPIVKNSSVNEFTRQEYLRLYPILEKDYNGFFIQNNDRSTENFMDWLKK